MILVASLGESIQRAGIFDLYGLKGIRAEKCAPNFYIETLLDYGVHKVSLYPRNRFAHFNTTDQ